MRVCLFVKASRIVHNLVENPLLPTAGGCKSAMMKFILCAAYLFLIPLALILVRFWFASMDFYLGTKLLNLDKRAHADLLKTLFA